MRTKGTWNETSGLLCEVETRNAEKKVSSSIGLVDLNSALPSLSSRIVMAKTPKAETDTDARIGTLPTEDVSIVAVLVGFGLDEKADLEGLLVKFEGGSILSLS